MKDHRRPQRSARVPWTATLFLLALCAGCARGDRETSQNVTAQETTRLTADPKTSLRIIDFNVWVGFQRGTVEEEAAEWLAAQEPDVVAFQELVGFTEENLRELAQSWGHSYAKLGVPDSGRYLGLGLTSRTPIEDAQVLTGNDIKLGILHCRTAGIDFFVVHLGHGSDEVRARETRAVIGEIRALQDPARPSVVLGDFNSTSRLDSEFYASHRARMLRAGNADVYAINEQQFDILNHDTMDAFMAGGWVDVVHRHQGVMTEEQASWPSRVRGAGRSHIRIDFILASTSLAERCLSARVMKEPATHRLSDHYPVMADFDWPE